MTTMPGYNPPDVDEAVKRVRELSDQMIELAKKNGLAWLEAYEKTLESMLRLQQQAAAGSQVEWINTLTTTNADFVREMSRVYIEAFKQQMK
jgi:hypothetical protein